MRIGLYGGTFNPVHKGHRRVIDAVCDQFRLNRVFVIPSANPPHKSVSNLAPVQSRIEMLNDTFADSSKYTISDVEAKRSGRSYTTDTIRYFKAEASRTDTLFLIMGLDAFIEINTWYQWQHLFDTAYEACLPVIVMTRPVDQTRSFEQAVEKITQYLDTHMPGYRWQENKSAFTHPGKTEIYVCRVPEMTESSTQIRNRIKQGDPWEIFVPATVAACIKKKGLYK